MPESTIIANRAIMPLTEQEIIERSSGAISSANKMKRIGKYFGFSTIISIIVIVNILKHYSLEQNLILEYGITFSIVMGLMFISIPGALIFWHFHSAKKNYYIRQYSPVGIIQQRTMQSLLKEPEMAEWDAYCKALKLINRPIYEYEYEEMNNFWQNSISQ